MSKVPDFALSEESKSVIKDIVTSKTIETQGILSLDELGDCLEAFGFNADDEDVDFLKKHLDDNGDGELEVKELMDNIDVINWHCFFGKELMREFCKIDTDGDGVIRYPEMLRVLLTRGPNPMEALEGRKLLDTLARKFDANFDGKFSYAEFVKIWMSDLLPFKDALGEEPEEEPEVVKKPNKPKKKLLKKKSSNLNGANAPAGSGSRYSPANLYGPKPGDRPKTSGTRTSAVSRAKSAKVKTTTPKT